MGLEGRGRRDEGVGWVGLEERGRRDEGVEWVGLEGSGRKDEEVGIGAAGRRGEKGSRIWVNECFVSFKGKFMAVLLQSTKTLLSTLTNVDCIMIKG